MSRLVALALVLAMLVAGCSAPVSPVEPAPATTERLTAAPVPETATAGAGGRGPPGLASDGVTDASALQRAHIETLSKAGFRGRYVRTVRYRNDTLRSRAEVMAIFPADGRYLVIETLSGPLHRRVGTAGIVRQYGGDTRTVRLTLALNGTVTGRDVEPPSDARVPRRGLLAAPFGGRTVLLGFRAVAIERVTASDGVYRIRGDGVDDSAALRTLLGPSLADTVTNVSLQATVDERGVVRRFRLVYTSRPGDRPLRVVRHLRFSTANATLDEPSWAADRNVTDR